MKIAIIGPGIMPIPPTGWGAVEILIWDEKLALEKFGHEVLIVNTPNPNDILKEARKLPTKSSQNLVNGEQNVPTLSFNEDKIFNENEIINKLKIKKIKLNLVL